MRSSFRSNQKNRRLIALAVGLLFIAKSTFAYTIDSSQLMPMDQKKVQEALQKNPLMNSGQIDELIREIMKSNNYDKIEARGLNNELKFIVKFKKTVEDINFFGLNSVRRGELKDIIRPLEGERYDQNKSIEVGEQIQQLLVFKGFQDAKVVMSLKEKSNTSVDIVYTINEGIKTLVGSVNFSSDNAILNKNLSRVLSRFRRRPFNNATISDLEVYANEYLKNERFMTAKLEQVNVKYTEEKRYANLNYRILDPVKFDVIFVGQKDFSNSDLIRAMDVRNAEQTLVDPASELPQRLKAFYLLKGYAHVKIEVTEEMVVARNARLLRFSIQEGPKVEIAKFEITGRMTRKAAYYRDVIKDNSGESVSSNLYHKESLDIGFRNLITDLNNQGFLRARIISSRVEYSKDLSRATAFVTIDEGPRTKITRLALNGISAISREKVVAALGLKENSDLLLLNLEKGLQEIKLLYGRSGHLEMRILNEGQENLVQYSSDGTTATVFLEIYEGPPIRVASIVLEGNDFTKDHVILRSLEFEKGDLLTIDKFNDSVLALNRTGLFNRLDIRSLEVGTATSERSIIVTVAERNPGLVRFGIGVNNERGFTVRGFTSVSYNNLGGTGRALTTRIELQEDIDDLQELEQRYSITFLEPHLLNSKIKGRVNYAFAREVTETNPKVIGESQRADTLLERDFGKFTKFTWTLWGIESFEEFREDATSSTAQRIAYVGPTLDLDFRDSIFSPTKGQYFRISNLFASPELGSSDGIKFLKTDASYTFYIPLGHPKWIFAQGVRGGHLINLDPVGAVPARYAFFLGGYSTIRGFGGREELETIPNELELPTESSDLTPLISTESSYFLVKSEIRFPIYDPLGGVIFYDGGQVSVLGYDFKDPFRQSIGLGLRINTPVGPVVLDYARKIDPRCFDTSDGKRCERDDRIHFSVGSY